MTDKTFEDCGRDVLDMYLGKFCCNKHKKEFDEGIQKMIDDDFSKMFPSLKIKNMLEIGTYSPLRKCCFIEDIQQHCLDKQIVERDYIKKDIAKVATLECSICGHEAEFSLSKEATLQSLEDMNWKQKVRDVIDKVKSEFKKDVEEKAKPGDFLINTTLVGANLYVTEQIKKELQL